MPMLNGPATSAVSKLIALTVRGKTAEGLVLVIAAVPDWVQQWLVTDCVWWWNNWAVCVVLACSGCLVTL